MKNHLGRWAVLDIETTGIDSHYDHIIDIGFLQFEGHQLVGRYQSLVRTDRQLSYFVQNLTGIDQKMVTKAPLWQNVLPEIQSLEDHKILAHNAKFEEAFLSKHFEEIDAPVSFQDSLPFLGLLFPKRSSLKLENYLIDWGIADCEQHRGMEDSIDLLKVLLVAVTLHRQDLASKQLLEALFERYQLDDYWYAIFYRQSEEALDELAQAIDFDYRNIVESLLNSNEKISELAPVEFDAEELGHGFSGDDIKNILRDEERVRTALPFYRYRQSQEELSLRTGQSFKNNVHSLIQAPTGTGKTLGYLLTSSLFSLREKEQVLVATGTKTLQEQAMNKDVPQLRKILNLSEKDLKIKRLIGSSNHFCELNFREYITDDLLNHTDDFTENYAKAFFDLVFHYNAATTGEHWIARDDIPYVLKKNFSTIQAIDQKIAVDYRACTGSRCPFANDCTYIRGLREAKEADIIVGNHALMFAWPRSFPRPRKVIVDEAHRLEDETTKAFSYEVSKEQLESFAKTLFHQQGIGSLYYLLAQHENERGESSAVIDQIRERTQHTYQILMDHLSPLEQAFELYFKKLSKYNPLFWNEVSFRPKGELTDQFLISINNHLESIFFVFGQLNDELTPHISRFDVNTVEGEQQMVALTRLDTFMAILSDIHDALKVFLDRLSGYTHSLNYHDDYGFALKACPIDTGKVLHDQLLQTSDSTVFVSATLANGGGSSGVRGMEWATGYIYLEGKKRFKQGFFLPSPYDYEKNTRVYLCDDLDHFSSANYVPQVINKIAPLIERLEGRTLLLFSARKRFEIARELLLERFGDDIPLFTQGMGNNIVEEFKNSGRGILLGLESFGEGIDIPGSVLQFIFIDKVPDLRMDNVINDRRQFFESNFGNEFEDYYLGHRTRGLHQKLGRLMRREEDIGGIIVADSRIKRWKGRTMDKFNQLMRPYDIKRETVEDACSLIEEFLIPPSKEIIAQDILEQTNLTPNY